jgi:hypothetical protein
VHKALKPLLKLKSKIQAADNGRLAGLGEGTSNDGDKTPAQGTSDGGSVAENVGGNDAVLMYVNRSLRHLRKADKSLIERLEVLYITLRHGEDFGRHAERLQKSSDCTSVYAKILKEVDDDAKRKKDKVEDEPLAKKRAFNGYGRGRGRNWGLHSSLAATVTSALLAQGLGGGLGAGGQAGFGGAGRGYPAGTGVPNQAGGGRRLSQYWTPEGVRKCFNCLKPGHVQANCPEPPK